MTRDYIYHHWAILRCSVYADRQLGPIVTIMITHNVTRSWESLFWKGKQFLNLDFSCFLCCLYLISAKHTDCMNSYQFSTADGKRRLKKWYNCTRGCLVRTEPEEKAMFTWRVGVTYLHTKDCLRSPGNHPQLGRSKGGFLPIFKGFMALPTTWFPSSTLQNCETTHFSCGALCNSPGKRMQWRTTNESHQCYCPRHCHWTLAILV